MSPQQLRAQTSSNRVSVHLAFVLLDTPKLPAAPRIVSAFASFAAKGEALHLTKSADSGSKGILEFELQPGGRVFVAFVPSPVPDQEADAAARFSISSFSTGWVLPSHHAHLIVSLTSGDSIPATAALSAFTSLLAAVAQASDAVGVYWGGAKATHDPKFFQSIAKEPDVASRLYLWTGVSLAKQSDGHLELLSLGMEQLHLPDLLLVAPARAGNDALSTLFRFLDYMVESGKAIPEGDTIGRTAEEELVIH